MKNVPTSNIIQNTLYVVSGIVMLLFVVTAGTAGFVVLGWVAVNTAEFIVEFLDDVFLTRHLIN